jgi:hypothetical protein
MRSERWKKHPSFALAIQSGKKTQRIACVFEFINIFKIYITKSLSKMYSKHTSLNAAYFTQTPFPPKKQTRFFRVACIHQQHGIWQAADRPKEGGDKENKKARP